MPGPMAEVDEVRLVASCRENADAAAAFAAEHGGKSYRDWRALLDDPAVDAVLIATPHDLHEEIAIGAAQAGKHILLEKPMAPNVAACDAVLAAADANGVKLMIGHVMHFALPCLKAKEIVDSGVLGAPVLGSSWMIKLWMESNRRPWHLNRRLRRRHADDGRHPRARPVDLAHGTAGGRGDRDDRHLSSTNRRPMMLP